MAGPIDAKAFNASVKINAPSTVKNQSHEEWGRKTFKESLEKRYIPENGPQSGIKKKEVESRWKDFV